jgi:Skp family chaperone for outer membrane proteins
MNAMKIVRSSILGLIVSAAFASGAAMAQDAQTTTPVPGHPRINEVNQRLQNQQNRIQNGVADHQINAKQEARDEKTDANIAQRESADEAKHNGHLTKQEQHNLNKSENRDSRRIRRQRTGT